MLDAKSDRAVATAVEQLQAALGGDLVAVALYGSAATEEFSARHSDINLVVVLREVSQVQLRALQPYVPQWRKLGIATPLVLDLEFLKRGADVFPMELLDIKERHRLLFGTDVWTELAVRGHNLRYQCEHEVRGKVLRLHELYLEIGPDAERLRHLLLDSVKTFVFVMRNMNRLRHLDGGVSSEDVVRIFAEHFHCDLPVLTQLVRIARGIVPWSGVADDLFHQYWAELQHLVRVVDTLPDHDPSPHPTR